jgi:hypothetical protein
MQRAVMGGFIFHEDRMKKSWILLLSLTMARVFGQAVPYGVEFLIKADFTLERYEFNVHPLQNGLFVACWGNNSQYDSDYRLYGQVFTSDGEKIGQVFHPNTYINGMQWGTHIASLPNGGFVVCWVSYGQDGDAYGVYGQVFSSNGLKQGQEFRVNTYVKDDQNLTQVVSLPNGDFVVCWDSHGQDGSGYGVYGQLFASDGGKIGKEFRINTHSAYSQYSEQVTALTNGGFAVCWNDYWEDVLAYGASGQVFLSDGTRTGQEFRINTYLDDQFLDPQITSLANGGFAISWDSDGHTGLGIGVYGRVFDSNGNRTSPEFFIPAMRRDSFINSWIFPLRAGGFVVYWESDGQDGSSWYAYGQLVASNGGLTGQTFRMNSVKQSNLLYPQLASLPDGSFMVCWVGVGPDGTANVYGRTYSSDGHATGREFRINTYRNSNPFLPRIISLSNGDLVVFWLGKAQEGGSTGLYAKRFPGFPIVHALQPFGLIEPSNDHTLKTCEFTFIWRQPDNRPVCYGRELNYQLFIDENPGFPSPRIIDQDLDTSAVVKGLKRGTTYFWKVLARNIADESLWSTNTNAFFVSQDATSGVETEQTIKPKMFMLQQNYPNPFNPETSIRFDLPQPGLVQISVVDISGRLVRVLVSESRIAGSYSVKWDGKDSFGNLVPSGIYICRMEVRSADGRRFTQSVKMGLVR